MAGPSWPRTRSGRCRCHKIGRLSDPDWDIGRDVEARLPFRLNDALAVFANGAGDYLCADAGQPGHDKAILWWHEEPDKPDVGEDFWAVMDGWVAGQVEDVDAARP